jgi:hypothetical protein
MSEKIISFLSSILLRFYNEIIASVWAILATIPLDNMLYRFFENEQTYEISLTYWICFAIYTVFFLTSASLVPVIKEWHVMKELNSLVKLHKITQQQKQKIKFIIKDVLIYKSIFTKEGLLQFCMANFFSIGVIFAYFGIEGIIANLLNSKRIIVPIIFILLFLVLLIFESFLDDYLAQKIRKNKINNHIRGLYGHNKTILMLILRNLGGGGSMSVNLSQLLIEDALEDICEILHISTSRDDIKSKKTIHVKKRMISRVQKSGQKHSLEKKEKPEKKKRKKRSTFSNY